MRFAGGTTFNFQLWRWLHTDFNVWWKLHISKRNSKNQPRPEIRKLPTPWTQVFLGPCFYRLSLPAFDRTASKVLRISTEKAWFCTHKLGGKSLGDMEFGVSGIRCMETHQHVKKKHLSKSNSYTYGRFRITRPWGYKELDMWVPQCSIRVTGLFMPYFSYHQTWLLVIHCCETK